MTKRVGSLILTFVKPTVTQFFLRLYDQGVKSPSKTVNLIPTANNDNFGRLTLLKVILTCKSTTKLLWQAF